MILNQSLLVKKLCHFCKQHEITFEYVSNIGYKKIKSLSCLLRKRCNFVIPKYKLGIGAWRSWLAYLHGVQVVGSSSLLAPTNQAGVSKY
jgi:hypothetical protein